MIELTRGVTSRLLKEFTDVGTRGRYFASGMELLESIEKNMDSFRLDEAFIINLQLINHLLSHHGCDIRKHGFGCALRYIATKHSNEGR